MKTPCICSMRPDIKFRSATLLTIEEGTAIQREQLARWAKYLKPEVYTRLEAAVMKRNPDAKCGHDIPRGTDIDYIFHTEIAPVI